MTGGCAANAATDVILGLLHTSNAAPPHSSVKNSLLCLYLCSLPITEEHIVKAYTFHTCAPAT